MRNWGLRLLQKMLMGMQKGMDEGMREILDEMIKGTLDSAKLAEMMKGLGIDMSQLSGMMQMPGFDAYRVLGLERSASDDELKRRYHELLKKLHPDTAGILGTEYLLQLVVSAYELIRQERGWS